MQCKKRLDKKRKREKEDEDIRHRMTQASDANLLNVSHQMPDRGHDAQRGTAGWVMGGLSPGRSF